jgi:UDP-N-acetylglucosamine 4-epimerase
VEYGSLRPGDIRHSGADIAKIVRELAFTPEPGIEAGLEETVRWYSAHQVH